MSAIRFLTILRIGPDGRPADLAASMAYFPAVGALIGLIGGAVNFGLIALHVDPFVAAVTVVAFITAVTGAMHLDGLADTCDAIFSGKEREKMLEIMRDPHTGAMGTTWLVFDILLKVALILAAPTAMKTAAIILMCVFSRWSMVLLMHIFPYARAEGKAAILISARSAGHFITATVFTAAMAAIVWGLQGLATFVVAATAACATGAYINRRLGGITGDTIGATGELVEIVTLFALSMLQRGML